MNIQYFFAIQVDKEYGQYNSGIVKKYYPNNVKKYLIRSLLIHLDYRQ